jgi:hypothetical protein
MSDKMKLRIPFEAVGDEPHGSLFFNTEWVAFPFSYRSIRRL